MTKLEILRSVKFGGYVAEDEAEELAAYFLKTDQFNKIVSGDTDIVYGPKGSGKSAIYLYLLRRGRKLPTRHDQTRCRRKVSRHARLQGAD